MGAASSARDGVHACSSARLLDFRGDLEGEAFQLLPKLGGSATR
jgi:hypothetical protein